MVLRFGSSALAGTAIALAISAEPLLADVVDRTAPLAPRVVSISITELPSTISPGEEAIFRIIGEFDDGSTKEITNDGLVHAYSLNPRIATVVEPGRLAAVSIGKATLEAVSVNGRHARASAATSIVIALAGDTDNDGVVDSAEVDNGLDPAFGGDAFGDLDRDGLTNAREIGIGTDLRNPDTDGDFVPDGIEVELGTNPLVSDRQPDPPAPAGDLDENCVVSILNRSVRVRPDGSWALGNIPSSQPSVRARATCLDEGQVRAGQSQLVALPPSGAVDQVEISFASTVPVPASLRLLSPVAELTSIGETATLRAIATYPDGTTADVTTSESGTRYRSSNPAVAEVSADGVVTAISSGVVLLSALNEGTLSVTRLLVTLSGDSDGDGMPDDWELANGLDPNDPADAWSDADRDGLAALDEYQRGLDPRDADSDDDGLEDGAEINQYGTDPALWDTDGDGISDGLEVQTGSDPLDPNSFNLAAVLIGLAVEPSDFLLIVNTIYGEGSRRLLVTGTLVDGRTIDITSSRYGTTYESSDLLVANFGPEDGRIYGGQDGQATITVRNLGFVAQSQVEVRVFVPQAVSSLPLPGFPNGIDVQGDYAYIASGAAGLLVVDVSVLSSPTLVAVVDTPGNANDVRVEGDRVYVADGANGVLIFDLSTPANPTLLGSTVTPGVATDLAVEGDTVFVADESGLAIVDATNPASPVLVGSSATPGRARGVDVEGGLAVVADTRSGIHVFDVSDPGQPLLLGTTHLRTTNRSYAADVVVRGGLAYVADGADIALGGIAIVDLSDLSTPVVVGRTSGRFGIWSVALDGELVLAADYLYANAVPIFSTEIPTPAFRALIDFRAASGRDDNGTGIDAREGAVFIVGTRDDYGDNGVEADGALHVGLYAVFSEDGGAAPTIAITSPAAGAVVPVRYPLELVADARDEVRVDSVEFYFDGQLVAEDFAPPFEVTVPVPRPGGPLTITAIATDGGGHRTTSEPVAVTKRFDEAPIVTIKTPLDGTIVPEESSFLVVAEAFDNVAVLGVEVAIDGVVKGSRQFPPYKFDLVAPSAVEQFTLTATAFDAQGPVSTSISIGVVPDLPPAVAIDFPPPGFSVIPGQLVRVSVFATDDLGVDRVLLTLDGSSAGEALEPPYAFDVSVPSGASSIRLQATAVDTRGQTAISDEIELQIVAVDPLTTVAGRVVDPASLAVTGAAVTCSGIGPATTDVAGGFTIPGVPTTTGPIRCRASWIDATGLDYTGLSTLVAPVQGGVTDVGTIVLKAAPGFLYAGAEIPLGEGTSLVVADLDGDGRLDLAGADWLFGHHAIYVRLARPNGSYREPAEVAALDNAENLQARDIDGDSVLDLVGESGSSIFFLRGLGDGSFEAPVLSAVGGSVKSIAVADFDGDTRVDVAAVSNTSTAATLRILLGDGTGAFSQSASELLTSPVVDLEAADLDGDGDVDLAVLMATANAADTVITRLNGGGALFAAGPARSLVFQRTTELALAYVDDDALLDLVVGEDTFSSSRVEIAWGVGGGSFGGTGNLRISLGNRPRALAVSDIDGDGRADVAAALDTADPPAVAILRRTGSRSFASPRRVPVAGGGYDLAVEDLDGSARKDIAVLTDLATVALIYQNADGSFDSELVPTYAAGSSPGATESGWLNNDGTPDIVSASFGDETIAVLLGRPDGTLAPAVLLPAGPAGFSPYEAAVGDLDGDGFDDIVLCDDSLDLLAIHTSLGDGSFLPPVTLATGDSPGGLLIRDVNGDGAPDLLSANWNSNDVSVHLRAGSGYLSEMRSPVGGDFVSALAAADFTSDGIVDLAVLADPIGILAGNGDGTFLEVASLAGPQEMVFDPLALAAADFDGDGATDLAASYARDDESRRFVLVFLGNGDGSFGEPILARTIGLPFGLDLVPVDADADGVVDLVLPSVGFPGGAVVLKGKGDGTFGTPVRYRTGCSPNHLSVTDLDLDSLPDVIAANGCDDNLTVLLHRD